MIGCLKNIKGTWPWVILASKLKGQEVSVENRISEIKTADGVVSENDRVQGVTMGPSG